MGMAVGLSIQDGFQRSQKRSKKATSCSPKQHIKSGKGCRKDSRCKQTRHLPYIPSQLCNSLARRRIRYPNGAGTFRPQGCIHDHDLYPRLKQGRKGGSKSFGSAAYDLTLWSNQPNHPIPNKIQSFTCLTRTTEF